MAKGINIRNRDKALLEILHYRVQNSGMSLYSICGSLSGCWSSREAIFSQGAAIGVDMSKPFRLLFGAESRHRVSLKGSDRYTLRHRRGIIPDHLQSVSLKGSDRYSPMAKPWDSFTPKFQ